MAAIGILDELRLAQARLMPGEQLVHLRRAADEDIGLRSEIKTHDIAMMVGQRLQEFEDISLTELGVQAALLLAPGGPGWGCGHQLTACELQAAGVLHATGALAGRP
jgi:hypothetical protein